MLPLLISVSSDFQLQTPRGITPQGPQTIPASEPWTESTFEVYVTFLYNFLIVYYNTTEF